MCGVPWLSFTWTTENELVMLLGIDNALMVRMIRQWLTRLIKFQSLNVRICLDIFFDARNLRDAHGAHYKTVIVWHLYNMNAPQTHWSFRFRFRFIFSQVHGAQCISTELLFSLFTAANGNIIIKLLRIIISISLSRKCYICTWYVSLFNGSTFRVRLSTYVLLATSLLFDFFPYHKMNRISLWTTKYNNFEFKRKMFGIIIITLAKIFFSSKK